MMLHAVESAKSMQKRQRTSKADGLKRKRTENLPEIPADNNMVKKTKLGSSEMGPEPHGALVWCDAGTEVAHPRTVAAVLKDNWESDSGFSSEASPPASGRNSPLPCPCPDTVVAVDCEMVGTGPCGRCSELARCSILDYHGRVLYDRYIRPSHPVTDYRTRWSGIQRHHLQNAVPFGEAREEILHMLEGKVIVGHSLFNDFKALDMFHPCHMVRDIGGIHCIRQLAGFPHNRCLSLKILANKLLNRRIQVGRRGHCSVEDSLAALDIYKLVENEVEQEMWNRTRDRDTVPQPGSTSLDQYMQDQYWPEHLADGGH